MNELRGHFAALPIDRRPTWGRMNAQQVLEHCRDFHRLCLGEIRPGAVTRRIARLLGPVFLRRFLRASPFEAPKNLRTLNEIRAEDRPGEIDATMFEARRSELLKSIDELSRVQDGHRHPLYGPMRGEDVRAIARHHMAHHLHQFGMISPSAVADPATGS